MRSMQSAVSLVMILLLLAGCSGDQITQISSASTEQPTPQINTQVGPETSAPAPTMYTRTELISSPDQAKQLLIDGNDRFVSGEILTKDLSQYRRDQLLRYGQHPFVVVVSCSDSRVPPEELFDQALGDLFVIRVAGNVISSIELGSVEYAVEHIKTSLIVVLGHDKCGAVTATVEGGEMPGSIGVIAEKIEPAVNQAKSSGATKDDLIEKSVDYNIQNAMDEIIKSPVIKHALDQNQVKLFGAKYHLSSGIVQWY